MEKVIVKQSMFNLSQTDVKEINDYLSNGWKVKHMQTTATKDYVTAIFVLEKPN